ncbi:hypothetical protein BDK51DRAFT_34321 [Blyttiomyces helicus]|uniref:Uncharacterized protein n=1 Tax=Blyttiomyces helicus TaxID=388810 RepID=A0A4P9WRK6_9FUNG|nr:hypothetical protein BDK51DRAFT_34321 [Blyttiomyces helicus]|eukprot:RKO93556.1 hypothetical protein BDK51DRAFT_34321 [Blyttiomyces helicus]
MAGGLSKVGTSLHSTYLLVSSLSRSASHRLASKPLSYQYSTFPRYASLQFQPCALSPDSTASGASQGFCEPDSMYKRNGGAANWERVRDPRPSETTEVAEEEKQQRGTRRNSGCKIRSDERYDPYRTSTWGPSRYQLSTQALQKSVELLAFHTNMEKTVRRFVGKGVVANRTTSKEEVNDERGKLASRSENGRKISSNLMYRQLGPWSYVRCAPASSPITGTCQNINASSEAFGKAFKTLDVGCGEKRLLLFEDEQREAHEAEEAHPAQYLAPDSRKTATRPRLQGRVGPHSIAASSVALSLAGEGMTRAAALSMAGGLSKVGTSMHSTFTSYASSQFEPSPDSTSLRTSQSFSEPDSMYKTIEGAANGGFVGDPCPSETIEVAEDERQLGTRFSSGCKIRRFLRKVFGRRRSHD